MPDSEKKLKRVVLKEELITLTGDWLKALILNQFLYWGKLRGDFDAFILEERLRIANLNIELTHGWIWKSVKELSGELMVKPLSNDTINRRLAEIVESGWLEQRRNPHHKWDRTYQYRPAIRKIQADLQALGYALEGYPLLIENSPIPRDAESSTQDAPLIPPGAEMNLDGAGALPEITTETTTEITTEKGAAEKKPPLSRTLSDLPDAERQAGLIFGNGSSHPAGEQLITRAGWNIRNHDHRLAVAIFLEASSLFIPDKKPERNDWLGSIDGHVKAYGVKALEDLYPKTIAHMRGQGLPVCRPGSVTKIMADMWARHKEWTKLAPPPPLPPSAPDPLAVAWGRVLDDLNTQTAAATFKAHFAGSRLIDRQNGDITIYLPNPDTLAWFKAKPSIENLLKQAVAAQMGDVRIAYTNEVSRCA